MRRAGRDARKLSTQDPARSPSPGMAAICAGIDRLSPGVDAIFAGMDDFPAGMEDIFPSVEDFLAGVEDFFAGVEARWTPIAPAPKPREQRFCRPPAGKAP